MADNKQVSETTLRLIETIVTKFFSKFRFGFFEADDIKQEIRIMCLEAINRFDSSKNIPLENFLTVHVRNRLINFKRDNFSRSQKPCQSCPFWDQHFQNSTSGCMAFSEKLECDKYRKWYERNARKRNLSGAAPNTERPHRDTHKPEYGKVEDAEIIGGILEFLPVSMRADFLKLLEGLKISKNRRIKLEEKLAEWKKLHF